MSSKPLRPVGNWILDSLPPEDYERLLPDIEPVSFSLGEVVYESGIKLRHVYFPTTCHVSLLYTMIDGATAEMGLVGHEGVVGSLSSWAVKRRRIEPWCKARARRFG